LAIEQQFAASWRRRLGAALTAAALIAGSTAFAQTAGHQYTVTMANMDYGAIPPKLKVGDTILWVNHDSVAHSVTARDHSFDLRINPNQSAKLPLTTAGRIPFYCLFHPTMRGTLNVEAK
jgi:plastocyanin